MAAAAIGASHLVASTRAGAEFGWQLAWLVLLFFKGALLSLLELVMIQAFMTTCIFA
ncbi:hypothetical protein TUM17387_08960 [Shewanella carassii]|uniref:hypothetical protein n=1 Tax=Shewanella carassii TaxID=1987584 RepID=UPI001BF04B97|nr:hypothetical protein TUM17387_08960 [Shewanella carassii]